jgi:O-antigen ligase
VYSVATASLQSRDGGSGGAGTAHPALPSHLAALACVLILPLALLYARALAEILIAATDILFLFQLCVTRARIDWRNKLLWFAAAWWAWQVICSALGTGGLVLALVAFRLPLFAVAVGDWVLASARPRRWLWWVIAAAVAWIVIESWQQYVFGTNIFGIPRFGDGALTGPFNRPRAGPALILTLFPVLVPSVAALVVSRRLTVKAAGGLVAILAAATVLLIGQRMPSVLLIIGLILTGAMLPRLRIAVAAAIVLGAALVATTPLTSPATYQKLVLRTRDQLTHFVYSPYGEIWVRAVVIAEEHPWRGLGFDGFRRGCGDPRAVRGLPEIGVTLAEALIATDACNIHPHNYVLEAADNGGLPLAALFLALVVGTWRRLARGLRRGVTPLRAGLLVGFTLAFWPIASTSALTAMPNAGWIILLTGFGFAEAREDRQAASNSST